MPSRDGTTTYSHAALSQFSMQIPSMPLVLEFFVAFSRFEYALKQAGFLADKRSPIAREQEKDRDAAADWDAFAAHLETTYQQDESAPLADAVGYLLSQSPRKQVAGHNGRLFWRNAPINDTSLGKILILVRRVRNNLFHGGKAASYIRDPTRDTRLIESCLIVLNSCLGWCECAEEEYKIQLVYYAFTGYML